MLPVQHHYPLHELNTFGMKVYAAHFSTFTDAAALTDIDTQPEFSKGFKVLGGGSNMLFTGNPGQWILHNRIKGIRLLQEDAQQVWLEVGAGELWHEFVLYCIHHHYAGVENLSLIPGTVGAAPIQNIGAYGVEVREVIDTVHCWHPQERRSVSFSNADCHFGYRDSIFKHDWKDQLIITHVVFRLSKTPDFRISYGQIGRELELMGVKELSLEKVSEAVIRIRKSKLPDPAEIGNAGSFFKNPEVTEERYRQLQQQFPGLPGFTLPGGRVKLPAAWLIEQCGWKGYRQDDYGVHQHQALVLVNYGQARGQDIALLSSKILTSVAQKFDISLEREVQIC